MALTVISFLCFVALLPFPGLGGSNDHSGKQESFSMKVTVTNKIANTSITYNTTAAQGMPMFGVLNELHKRNNSFNFTNTINDSYGIFVNGVNGVNGSTENHTYWELLSKRGSTITPLSVGVGCYLPEQNEIFIMNFTTRGYTFTSCGHIYGYK